ncbi:hypothetical protein V6O07_10495, partial [Arthrospira platensis SPKY2]
EPEEHPQLFCGFDFEVTPAERIELYISIEGHQYHRQTIESTPVPYKVIARIQQTWRNYITNNLQDISDSDAEALQSLTPAAIERYIYGKPEAASRNSIKLAINYLDLSDTQRSYLEKFLDFTSSPELCADLVESALNKGFCQIPNPFGEGYAACRESYHQGGRTLLRFVTPMSTSVYIVQVRADNLVYIPEINLDYINYYWAPPHTLGGIVNIIRNFIKNLSYTAKSQIHKFGGIIYSYGRPSHFYYDICLALYYLFKKGLLNQFSDVYNKYYAVTFFDIDSLFNLDKSSSFEMSNLQIFSDKCHADNEFYIHMCTYGHKVNNRLDKEKLSEMIVSTAAELVDDATAEEVKQARKCYPLLWFG